MIYPELRDRVVEAISRIHTPHLYNADVEADAALRVVREALREVAPCEFQVRDSFGYKRGVCGRTCAPHKNDGHKPQTPSWLAVLGEDDDGK